MSNRLDLLTYIEANQLIEEKRPLLIPFGTQEAHGPHLPMGTDSFCAESLSQKIAEIISGVVAPTLHYGITNSLYQFGPATKFKEGTYYTFVYELIRNYLELGFERLILFNGHGGNNKTLEECARKLSKEFRCLIIVIHWWDIAKPLLKKYYQGSGAHAGAEETAVILNFLPDLVKKDQVIESEETVRGPGYISYPMDGTIIYSNEDSPSFPDFNEETAENFVEDTIKLIVERLRKTMLYYKRRALK